MSRSVLVVDDEADIRSLLRELLEEVGFRVGEAADGKACLRALFAAQPDLILLDITMPELDGYETLGRIRDVSNVPVLMLTSRAAELEKVRGLRAGADDYVSKPFGRQELLARVEALLRRAGEPVTAHERYADAFIAIDFANRAVTAGGNPVALTPREFALLTVFVRNPNVVLSRARLLELVWSDPYAISPDQARLYVSYLRRKLAAAAGEPAPIETVRGFGYRYTRATPR